MSFLDNLENSLKSLETSEEAAEGRQREYDRRQSERARTMAAAPWAEKLKHSAYTVQLLKQATAAGFQLRAKVYISWIGSNLRLEARGRKLELQPTGEGVIAALSGVGMEPQTQPVNLDGSPDSLVKLFLQTA